MGGASTSTLPEEMRLDEASEHELRNGTEDLKHRYEALKALEGRDEPHKPKRLVIRFCLSPVEILGDDQGRVRALKLVRNALFMDE